MPALSGCTERLIGITEVGGIGTPDGINSLSSPVLFDTISNASVLGYNGLLLVAFTVMIWWE